MTMNLETREWQGQRVQLEIAVQQRVGDFNVLRQGTVELATR